MENIESTMLNPGDLQTICRDVIRRLQRKFRQVDLETAAEIQIAVDDALKEWGSRNLQTVNIKQDLFKEAVQ